MDDPLLVRRFECVGDLPRDGQGFVEWDWPARDALRQILALDQFHDERTDTARFFEAMDVRDVRVIQRRQRLRFARKPGQAIGIAGKGVRKDLQRDVAIQFRVARAIDFAHATRADRRGDFIDAETGAGGKCHVEVSICAASEGGRCQLLLRAVVFTTNATSFSAENFLRSVYSDVRVGLRPRARLK